MPLTVTRNAVFTALLNLLKTAAMPASIGPIQIYSQRFVPWENCAQQPAMMLLEGPQTASQKGPFGLTQWSMQAVVLVYFRVDPALDGVVPAQQVNDLLDAIEAALRMPSEAQRQTLGGLVANAYIDGAVGFDDGTTDQSYQAVVFIPIRIAVA